VVQIEFRGVIDLEIHSVPHAGDKCSSDIIPVAANHLSLQKPVLQHVHTCQGQFLQNS